MYFLFVILFLLINSIKSCPLTDNYLSRCHCGILTNSESYIKCDEQTLDQIPIFKRSFPYDELILSNNKITNLSRSSFDNIKTIRRINLENNSLSFIDSDLLRLLGNYLEELILTGDNKINSLEFLTRYPLKKLRVLKLNQFNLSEINFEKLFLNMTKLEFIYLRSCQLKHIPNISNIQLLDLENNQISNLIYLSTSYIYLNLAENFISSIILEKNLKLEILNLSKNHLKEFYLISQTNQNLKDLNLSYNSLTSFDLKNLNENLINLNLNFNYLLSINLNELPKKLISLSLKHNLIKQIKYSINNLSSLISIDLSFNQLKFLEKNSLFNKLNYLNLEHNPLECNCQLEWLKNLSMKKFNTTTWTCYSNKSSFILENFQCLSFKIPQIQLFNVTYIKNLLSIRWLIIDDDKLVNYIQISISELFYLSPKISSNQTEIFLSNLIQLNKQYHICLILFHKYSHEKYCREFFIEKILTNEQQFDINLYMILIGTCIGGLLTILLIFTCCYLCYKIHKYHIKKKTNKTNYSCYLKNTNLHYPIYHSNTCPYHHHENLSNSTDSSHIDGSLSTTNLKHIYQTIDSQDYSNLKHDTQLFHLWNESLRHKR